MSVPKHRTIFINENGPGPWPCYGCGELVTAKLTVHHLDEDHDNNDPTNLVAMHHACHSSLHHAGKIVSDETRAKIAEIRRGVPRSPETRAKIGNFFRGKKLSDEHRRKMSESQRGRPKTEEQKLKISRAKRGKPWTQARRDAANRNKEEAP